MAKNKQKYNVYKTFFDMSDEGFDSGLEGRVTWCGSTYAVSASKAICNIKFNKYGHAGTTCRDIISTAHTAAIPIYEAFVQFSAEDKEMYLKTKER